MCNAPPVWYKANRLLKQNSALRKIGKQQGELENHLEHLFDMEVQYSTEGVECAPIGIAEGRIIGSGDGIISGPSINGIVKWSNYENAVRDGLCKLQIPGSIRTNDNEEIVFEARGIAATLDKLNHMNRALPEFFTLILTAKNTVG